MGSLGIIPAAGRGERFGGAKLLADIGGVPMLDRTIRCLLDGGVDQVVVVLPPAGRFDTVRLLTDPAVLVAINPDPSRGMFSSIQIGAAAAEGEPLIVLPGDMPFVSSTTVASVIAAHARARGIVVPRNAGKHGHPIALPASMREAILAAAPTDTLDRVLKSSNLSRLALDVEDAGILRDVDVPTDL